jgi:hypothetical protein
MNCSLFPFSAVLNRNCSGINNLRTIVAVVIIKAALVHFADKHA